MGLEVVDEGVVEGLALHSSKGRVALVATVAASAMASLDATVVNVALPHIGEQFHASISALQWVLTGYLVALASLILLGGALGDRFGRSKVFVIGTIWFAAASLLCGAAPNIEVLVAARVLQGVGGALLTPGSLAILRRASAGPIGQRLLAPGQDSVVLPAQSDRSSAVASSTARVGDGRSSSTFQSRQSRSLAHTRRFRKPATRTPAAVSI